jgi:ATP-binding cassette subfamily F protein 3
MVYQICEGLISYSANTILQDINFEIRDKEKIAVVGRNGCGKSTLLKTIAGMIDLEEGYINVVGKPTIGYLEQVAFKDTSITAKEEIKKAFGKITEFEDKMNYLTEQLMKNSSEQLVKEFSHAQEQFESLGGYTYKSEMEAVFTKFGFDIEDIKKPLSEFSGGQQTKISFIKLLLSKPDILLLDEPTNHLDIATIEWLEGYLKSYNNAIVIVSHDRMFLDQITNVTYEIEYLEMTRYAGNYTAFIEQKKINFEKQSKDYESQQKEIERLNALIERFKGKPTKVAMTRSKIKAIEHMEKVEKPRKSDLKKFKAGFSPRLKGGQMVMAIDSLKVGYDKPLCEVSLNITNGQRIAIIGGNGVGKSTFLKTLVGQLEALGGTYRYGHEIEVGYFDQQLVQYVNDKTVIDDFWYEYPKMLQTEVRSILGCFLFSGDDVFKKVNVLSGGERVRLYLAKLLQKKPNFLILDEPTNHLDILGKEVLEELLKGYTGTVLFVSHDRYFVRQISDTIVSMEEGKVNYYPYGYEEYMEKMVQRDIQNDPNSKEKAEKEKTPKTKYSSPKKEADRKQRKIDNMEKKIEEQEEKINKIKEEMYNPDLTLGYEKLGELDVALHQEEAKLEELMEQWDSLMEDN